MYMYTYIYIYTYIYTYIAIFSDLHGEITNPPCKSEGYTTSPHVNPRLPHVNLVW